MIWRARVNERVSTSHVTILSCMSAVYPRPAQAPRAGALPARLAMLAILLVAFALRAYRLDFQSLWSDEGISLLRSSQSLPAMLRNMPVEHTPGYFVLLHGWLALAGTSDTALRWLSLLPSVLAVALMFRLGVSLGAAEASRSSVQQLVAVLGALLLATSGFQIWYAQEARMYAWLSGRGPYVMPGTVAGAGTTRRSAWCTRQLVGTPVCALYGRCRLPAPVWRAAAAGAGGLRLGLACRTP